MYCMNCGKEIEDNVKVCEFCGASQETKKTLEVQREKLEKMDKKKKGSILGGTIVAVIIAVMLIFAGKTVNLSKYVTLTANGYEGYGTAAWEFDSEQFQKDYGRKLKFTGEAEEFRGWMTPCEAVELAFTGSLDVDSGLSNGDKVTFSWDEVPEAEVAKVFSHKFKLKDVVITVEGLEEIASFDAFSDVYVEFSGCEPVAKVKVINNSQDSFLQSLQYVADVDSGLSNGDIVTVTIDVPYQDDVAIYCAENYGMVPESVSKEFVVEGLNAFATSLEQIPQNMMEKMQEAVEEQILSQAEDDWREEVSIEEIEYKGSYLLNIKPNAWSSNRDNILYFVYNVNAHEDFSEDGVDNHFNYYCYGTFKNVMIMPDGTCAVDFEAMNTCGQTFVRELPISNGWRGNVNLYYYGYETLEDLFERCVSAQTDAYTYISNVE